MDLLILKYSYSPLHQQQKHFVYIYLYIYIYHTYEYFGIISLLKNTWYYYIVWCLQYRRSSYKVLIRTKFTSLL